MLADQTPQEEQSVELPLLAAPRSEVRFVNDLVSLELAVAALTKKDSTIAIDAERASGFKYSQRAYLIQLKSEDSEIYMLDPVASPEAMQSKAYKYLQDYLSQQEWILHAATQDLTCLREVGLHPGKIFDTELAARLAGLPRVGLGALTESILGMRLAKEHSAADWSTRPLPSSWLNYAALDVDVLHELQLGVLELLKKQDKIDWANEEFTNLLSFQPKIQREDKWRTVSGLQKISDRASLEIARKLWLAREDLAIKMDVAAGRLIPDSSILNAAVSKPKTKPELAGMKTFAGRASRTYLDHWWKAINEANSSLHLPEVKAPSLGGIPNHRNWATKYPEADKRLRLARTAVSLIAEEKALPIENLLTPDLLRQICFSPPEDLSEVAVSRNLLDLGARNWQVKLVASVIADAFHLSLQVDSDPQ